MIFVIIILVVCVGFRCGTLMHDTCGDLFDSNEERTQAQRNARAMRELHKELARVEKKS